MATCRVKEVSREQLGASSEFLLCFALCNWMEDRLDIGFSPNKMGEGSVVAKISKNTASEDTGVIFTIIKY